MLKWWITLCLALIGGTLSIMIGFAQDVRLMTISYRAAILVIVLAAVGYVFGGMAETYVNRLKAELQSTGKNIDIISVNEGDSDDFAIDSSSCDAAFKPFTPDSFDRVSGDE